MREFLIKSVVCVKYDPHYGLEGDGNVMDDQLNGMDDKTEQKVETFASAPAAERTKAEIRNRNTTKNKVDYSPLNESKKAQFERLLKIRNKK